MKNEKIQLHHFFYYYLFLWNFWISKGCLFHLTNELSIEMACQCWVVSLQYNIFSCAVMYIVILYSSIQSDLLRFYYFIISFIFYHRGFPQHSFNIGRKWSWKSQTVNTQSNYSTWNKILTYSKNQGRCFTGN
jgi:hypothetical protein